MRWLSVKHKKLNKLLTFVSLFAVSVMAIGLDENRLWLPAKYHTLYLDLKESALAAEALDDCKEVLRGTLDLDQSEPKRPVFRLLCRRPDGMSYNEMVDGITKKTLTTVITEPVELTPQELEQLRLETVQREVEVQQNKKQQLRESCMQEFERATALMLDKRVLTPADAEPIRYGEEQAIFQVDFNARSINGRHLQYRVTCIANSMTEVEVRIEPRRE